MSRTDRIRSFIEYNEKVIANVSGKYHEAAIAHAYDRLAHWNNVLRGIHNA